MIIPQNIPLVEYPKLCSVSYFCKKLYPMPNFLKLLIKEVKRETAAAVSILFNVPEELKENYKFKSKSEMYDYLNGMKKKVTLNDVKMADGTLKDITITKGESLQMYMWGKDETLEEYKQQEHIKVFRLPCVDSLIHQKQNEQQNL